ncbi:MAG: hypothetical protein QOE61_4719 [Micromonosporaceae bacterium]|jgi:hypothetical protein|nr:hypothetical protein [Micromonosporaceae bacterium]
MATYSAGARQTFADLQAIVDAHPVSSADGRCETCGVFGPCVPRGAALHALAVRSELPQRRAGATHPERVGARRVRLG